MIVTLSKSDLSLTIARAIATTDRNSSHPLTGFLLLEAKPNLFTISSTTLRASTIASCNAQVSKDGSAVVNADRLNNIVSGFDSEDLVSIKQTDKVIIFSQRSRRYEMKFQDPDSFPEVSIIQEGDDAIQLPSNALDQLFERTQRSIDPEKNLISGIYFHAHGKTIEALSTAYQWSSYASVDIASDVPDTWFFVPYTFFKSAKHMFSDTEFVRVGSNDRYLYLSTHQFQTGTHLQQGITLPIGDGLRQFEVEMKKLSNPLEIMGDTGFNCHPTHLAAALDAVARGVSKAGFTPVHLDISNDMLRIVGTSVDGDCSNAADTVHSLGISGAHPDINLNINSYYLSEVLKSVTPHIPKNVVLKSVDVGMSQPILGISIGSSEADFGVATYLISSLSPPKEEPKKEGKKR